MFPSKICGATLRITTSMNSAKQSRALSTSSKKEQKPHSILKKAEPSTTKTPRPPFPIRKHCIFFATANSGLPVSNVTKFHNLRNADAGRKPGGNTQQARDYVTPGQSGQRGEHQSPRGFPRLREPGQNSDYQYFDPAFRTRQQQIAQIKNKLRNQGLVRTPDDVNEPYKPWSN